MTSARAIARPIHVIGAGLAIGMHTPLLAQQVLLPHRIGSAMTLPVVPGQMSGASSSSDATGDAAAGSDATDRRPTSLRSVAGLDLSTVPISASATFHPAARLSPSLTRSAAGRRLGGGADYPSPEAVTLDPRDIFELRIRSLSNASGR